MINNHTGELIQWTIRTETQRQHFNIWAAETLFLKKNVLDHNILLANTAVPLLFSYATIIMLLFAVYVHT